MVPGGVNEDEKFCARSLFKVVQATKKIVLATIRIKNRNLINIGLYVKNEFKIGLSCR